MSNSTNLFGCMVIFLTVHGQHMSHGRHYLSKMFCGTSYAYCPQPRYCEYGVGGSKSVPLLRI
eukprot:7448793-Pyramimonas_sp.AAC.1